jgi:hypothetical protein
MDHSFTHDDESGRIVQDGVRYIMMRPDVLMGIFRHLGSMTVLVKAMEESAFENARDSFNRYKAAGFFDGGDALLKSCAISARLGWGRWRPETKPDGELLVHVHHSPFAAGVGSSEVPVCGSISGILRAIYITAYGEEVRAEETHCKTQGHEHCQFTVRRNYRSRG